LVLLRNAKGFIYPSLNEGFGIPLAEAAAMKLPFMVSDIPVFKELIGLETECLFKPDNINSISQALMKLNDGNIGQNLGANWTNLHQSIIDKTHPDQVAKQLMEIYQL
jgi:glycosyltransferase involved in cell wall biosynthesis